jgi:integrase
MKMPRERTGSIVRRKDRPGLWVRVKYTDDQGRVKVIQRKVDTRTEGKTLIKKLLREIEEHGSKIIEGDKLLFRELAAKYAEHKLQPPEYEGETKVAGLRSYKSQLRRLKTLVAYFGAKRVKSMTHADIEKYKITRLKSKSKRNPDQKLKVATVNRELQLLRPMFNFARRQGWIIRSPFERGDPLIVTSQEAVRERVLSTEEQRRLLQACQIPTRRHIFPIVLTALDSGCRSGELLKLRWRDIDFDRKTLRVTAMNAKTNKARVIDLEPITVAELRKLGEISGAFDDELVFGIKDNFRKSWESALKEAGIEGARFHDLRATAITFWLVRGMQTAFAMRRSGHSDQKTFMRYVRMCEEIQQKQREHLREWELAASLAELANESRDGLNIEPERSKMIN